MMAVSNFNDHLIHQLLLNGSVRDLPDVGLIKIILKPFEFPWCEVILELPVIRRFRQFISTKP
jgi:hypothetical protein